MARNLIEQLESRRLLSISAVFVPATGILNVTGDSGNNTITVSRNAAGKIKVNGNSVSISGGTPTVANTILISISGLNGNDNLSLDEGNGTLPAANIFGGAGNDLIVGGSGADQLFGQAGNDTLLGNAGNDLLFGGDNNDVLTGGPGSDQVFGEAGNDTLISNAGDGSDLLEGGDDTDTVQVNGSDVAEAFTVTPNGSRVRFDEIVPAPFALDIGTTENLVVNCNGGDDTFTGSNGLAPLIAVSVDGGAGNDSITGGDGNDTLRGGDGNDLIVGGRGADTAFMGAGNDTFVWNPGDGSDVVEGQGDTDTLQFNGSNVNENINLSASGNRLELFRDVGNVNMDTHGVEIVNLNALGGADNITLGDVSSTALTQFNVDLSSPPGSGTGDGQADTLTLNGTAKADNVTVTGSGTSYAVTGLPVTVNVLGSEGANDALVVNLLAGKDTFNASALPAGVTRLTVDGGDDNDVIIGSQGDDVLIGGNNNDVITGGRGNDVAFLGAGNDTFIWNPGDGSDIVEGQDDTDTLQFNGSNANENIDLSANGSRARLFRDVGNVTMDLNGIENINIAALGGADTLTVNDMTGTNVTKVNIDLSATPGTGIGDGQPDSVIVNGTAGDDDIIATGKNGNIAINGLAAQINIAGAEGASDVLTINALAGNDTVDASGLKASVLNLVINGGDDNDILTGSPGADLILGGRGSDVALMGAGNDTFVWNPGDGSDSVEGQGDTDTLQFNGSNVNENMDLSANGTRVRLFRDVGNVTMDLNGVENVNITALGGADTLTVNDLTGTGVAAVNIDLGTAGGGSGDGQADNVIVNATNGDDNIQVAGSAGSASVTGLAAVVNIANAEPANDRLTVNGLGGDDVIDASGLAATTIQLTEDGGDGNDVLIGGSGDDILLGGANDDVLIGGPGTDILDGGAGNNILIQ